MGKHRSRNRAVRIPTRDYRVMTSREVVWIIIAAIIGWILVLTLTGFLIWFSIE